MFGFDPFSMLFEQMFQGLAMQPELFAGMMAGTGMPPPEPGQMFGGAPLGAYAANTGFQQGQFPQTPQVDPNAVIAQAQGPGGGMPMAQRGMTQNHPQAQSTPTQMNPQLQEGPTQVKNVQGDPVSAVTGGQAQGAPSSGVKNNFQDFSAGRTGPALDPKKVDRIVMHDISGDPKTRKLPDPQNTKEYHLSFDDKGVYQHVPFGTQAPHAKNYNSSSVGIAYRGFEGDKLSPAAIANGRIARDMAMKQFPGIKPENIGTHPSLGREGTRAYPKDAREGAWISDVMADRTPQQPQSSAVANAVTGKDPRISPAQVKQMFTPQPQPQAVPQRTMTAQMGLGLGDLIPNPIGGGQSLGQLIEGLPKSENYVDPVTAGADQADISGDMGGGEPPTPTQVAGATPQPKLGGDPRANPATGDPAAEGAQPGQQAGGQGYGRMSAVPPAMNPMVAAAKALTPGSSDQRPIMSGGITGAGKAPEMQKATKGVTSITSDIIMQLLGQRRQNPLIAPTLGSLLRG